MKLLLLAAAAAMTVGSFEGETDVGNPAIKGSATYEAASKEYRLTGAGVNMWAKADEFHFLWRKVSGDVRISATVRFVGESPTAHRKAGVMLRKTLDGGSPYVDAVIHGDGLTEIQDRETPDDITRGFRFPFKAPARIALERRGNLYLLFYGNPGEPLREAGSIQLNIGNDLYAGIFVCSHDPKRTETAVFSEVAIEPLSRQTR